MSPRFAPLYLASLLTVLAAAPAGAQVAAAPAASAAARVPVEAFFEPSAFGGAALSPNGKLLAARTAAPGRHDMLVVIDLATQKPTVVAAYDDSDVAQFRWVNNERLVYNVDDKTVGAGDKRHYPGLFAVDKDGGRAIQLVDRYHSSVGGAAKTFGRTMLSGDHYLDNQRGPQDSDFVYLKRAVVAGEELRHMVLVRVNTVTGQSEIVPRPFDVDDWTLDHKGEPRLVERTVKGVTTIHYRDPATSQWRVLSSYNAYKDKDVFKPIGFDDAGVLYVEANNGQDTTALYTYDVKTGKLGAAPLVTVAGYDFNGGLVTNRNKVLGVGLTTDAAAIEWFDPAMKAMQAKLDKLLPVTVNLIQVPSDPAAEHVLVRSYSDVVPSVYSIYNIKTGELARIGSAQQSIDPAKMGPQKAVTYTARDGLPMTGLLTLPRAGTRKNLPMVVLVHGGPWAPGSTWGWNPHSQFLASRGYAVLEPNFRGTTGFGYKHRLASFKQWGLAMQDDITDITQWAIAQGYADPKRICIAGASYGGYATLMGLIKTPELFKCGIDWVGVTDINLLYSGDWTASSDLGAQWRDYGMPQLVGDRVKDAAQLKATSPIELAAKVTQPVILAYGGVDMRVPLYHGRKFYNAVKATNKNVEFIEYPEEGHGWRLLKNNVDFWTRVEKFLDKNIGAAQ